VKPKSWPIIRKTNHKNGAAAWVVDCRISGAGERLFFKTKVEAETIAAQKRVTRKNVGVAGVTIPERLRIEALDCQQRLEGVNASLTEAVNFFLKHAKPVGGKIGLADAIIELLNSKQKSGKRESYIKILGWVLNAFAREHPGMSVNDFTRHDVEKWLDGIENLTTRRNRIRDLSILFEFCRRRGYCGSNPLQNIERPIVSNKRPEIFTIKEVVALLTTAEIHPELEMVPTIAIGLFAGLRMNEIKQLDWHAVNFEHHIIDVDESVAKTRQQRNVDLSEHLVEWLMPHAKTEGRIIPIGFRDKMVRLRELAGITKWPDNGLRHSFGSYHVAHYQNPNMTALQMGHTTTDMLFKHYRNYRISKSDAARYWEIKPSTEAEMVVAFTTGKS
jgi:integrase